MLDESKVPKENFCHYKENLKTKFMLSINESVCCNIVMPWKANCVFSFNGQSNLSENSDYHSHPELVLNGFENNKPNAINCANCTESIRHDKIPRNSIANKVNFGIGSKIGLENHMFGTTPISLCKHQQSAIKGSSIFAPQIVTIEKSYHIQFKCYLSSHECTGLMLTLYSYTERIPFLTTLAEKNLLAAAGHNAKSENSPMHVEPQTAAS